MEIELKSRYQKISGRNINNENYDSNDSESDDSGDDDMQAYDGFVGVIQTRSSTSVTSEWNILFILNLFLMTNNT